MGRGYDPSEHGGISQRVGLQSRYVPRITVEKCIPGKLWLIVALDPELFTEPDTFAPQRWLANSSNAHTHQYAFGIGGRMCVASHLAHNALYTVFLHLIAHFHILPAEGETVEAIDPIKGLKGFSFVGTPRGWRARFVPREGGEKLAAWLDSPDG